MNMAENKYVPHCLNFPVAACEELHNIHVTLEKIANSLSRLTITTEKHNGDY